MYAAEHDLSVDPAEVDERDLAARDGPRRAGGARGPARASRLTRAELVTLAERLLLVNVVQQAVVDERLDEEALQCGLRRAGARRSRTSRWRTSCSRIEAEAEEIARDGHAGDLRAGRAPRLDRPERGGQRRGPRLVSEGRVRIAVRRGLRRRRARAGGGRDLGAGADAVRLARHLHDRVARSRRSRTCASSCARRRSARCSRRGWLEQIEATNVEVNPRFGQLDVETGRGARGAEHRVRHRRAPRRARRRGRRPGRDDGRPGPAPLTSPKARSRHRRGVSGSSISSGSWRDCAVPADARGTRSRRTPPSRATCSRRRTRRSTRSTPDDRDRLREELGDVLLQVVFHAQMAADDGAWDVDDVARGIVREADPPAPARVRRRRGRGCRRGPRELGAHQGGREGRAGPRARHPRDAAGARPRREGPAPRGRVGVRVAFGRCRARGASRGGRRARSRTPTPSTPRRRSATCCSRRSRSRVALGVDAESALRRTIRGFAERYERFKALAAERGLELDAMSESEIRALFRAARSD